MIEKKNYEDMLEQIQGATKEELKMTVFMKDSEDFERIDSMNLDPEIKTSLLRMLKDRTWLELAVIKKLSA